ncbi:cupredoxin domain-containing protein [Candidatus Woesearchaeota archaeon]|nr:cupredoxin domain-containing protein [Candidatus Woesearchaeota archaeon]
MKKTIIPFLLILVLTLTISACTTSSSETTANTQVTTAATASTSDNTDKEVHIDMFNFGFIQDPITIQKGDRVRLRITSSQGTHSLTIPELGLSTGAISAGQQQVLEFTAKQSGAFNYFCTIPCGSGHRTMRGQLTIE